MSDYKISADVANCEVMNHQTETRSRSENETSLQLLGCATTGGEISGGNIENFKEGWALPIFNNGKAHFFTLRPFTAGINPRTSHHMAVSKCGVINDPTLLLGAGNYQQCKKCAKTKKV